MKISIIVPTCPAQAEDTFSPKSNSMFLYPQEYDDDAQETFSTHFSSESEGVYSEPFNEAVYTRDELDSFIMFDQMQENRFAGPTRDPYNDHSGLAPRGAEPLSANSMYNSLVVGPTAKGSNAPWDVEQDKVRSSTPSTLPTSHSASTGAPLSESIENQMGQNVMENASPDEVYRRLVIGSSPAPVAHPVQGKSTLHTHSFQSVESNNSSQVVYQSANNNNNNNMITNKMWNPHFSLHADIVEDEEEEDTQNMLLPRMDEGSMYKTWAMSPLMMAAAAAPGKIQAKALESRSKKPKQKKNATQGIACAAEAIENDLVAMIDSLWCGMFGTGNQELEEVGEEDDDDEERAEQEDAEEQVPITRLSADLRKQRLRNQVLSHERDTVNKENVELREQLKEKESDVAAMKQRIQDLEEAKKKVEDESVERGMRTATMMNEFLEHQLEFA
jgi:hypothetical protein